jgi:hypothetical protein
LGWAAIGLLLLASQGGFTDAAWFLCGIVLLAMLAMGGGFSLSPPAKPMLAVALLLAAVYAVSALFSGATMEAAAETAKALVFCLALALCGAVPRPDAASHEKGAALGRGR